MFRDFVRLIGAAAAVVKVMVAGPPLEAFSVLLTQRLPVSIHHCRLEGESVGEVFVDRPNDAAWTLWHGMDM